MWLFLLALSLSWPPPGRSSTDRDALWQELLAIPDQTFERIFLPAYLTGTGGHLHQLSPGCRSELRRTVAGLRHRQTWAVAMLNAWGRMPPAGFVRGTLLDLGDWDQCVAVPGAQYCLVAVKFPMPQRPTQHNLLHPTRDLLPAGGDSPFLTNGSLYRHLEAASSIFHYGWLETAVCLPETCTERELAELAGPDVQRMGLQLKAVRCNAREAGFVGHANGGARNLALVVLLAVCTVSLVALLYDHGWRPAAADRGGSMVLLWFSPSRNLAKLLATAPSCSDELACIHGIRVLTIAWIVVGHTLDWNNVHVFRDSFSLKERLSELWTQPLLRAHFAVETFFHLSGLLTAYMSLKYCHGQYRNFSPFSYLALRYVRLTPQLVAFMLLSSLLPGLFDGPLWPAYLDRMFGQCRRTWWHNLVYLQNLIDNDNICAIHTWYLAADMQLHWLALLPVTAWLVRPSCGRTLTWILVAGSALLSGALIYHDRLPPGYVVTAKSDFLDEHGKPSRLVRFFHKPWNHGSVFFIGFLLGGHLYRSGGRPAVSLSRPARYALWAAALLGYLAAIFSNSPWLHGRAYQPFCSGLVFTVNRLLWAAVLSLLIWLCVTGNETAGLARLLSWPALRPLSRLTYAVYLVHAWVFTVAVGTRRSPVEIGGSSLAFLCAGILFLSYLVAFLFALFFECPLINALDWLKTMLATRHKTTSNQSPAATAPTTTPMC